MANQAWRALAVGVTAAWIVASTTAFAQDTRPSLDVHFVPTPQELVERMLEMANVTKDDFVIDLGSGDGRIPITAAQKYGARGMGVDLDPERIKEASENLEKADVGDRVTFVQQNLFETDISEATVITMYLLQSLNAKLRPTLLDLKPGTRIVSHAFDLGDWKADRHDVLDGRSAYFWVVPAKVEGRWEVQDGDRKFTIELTQRFQMIEGTASIGDSTIPLRETALRGDEIRFVIDTPDGESRLFQGRIEDDKIEAMPADDGGATPAGDWQASRAS